MDTMCPFGVSKCLFGKTAQTKIRKKIMQNCRIFGDIAQIECRNELVQHSPSKVNDMEVHNTAKKRHFSDLGIEMLMLQMNEMIYVSQNHTLIILSTKCISSNALHESAVDEINYVSQNHTVDSRNALDGIIHVRFHDTKA